MPISHKDPSTARRLAPAVVLVAGVSLEASIIERPTSWVVSGEAAKSGEHFLIYAR